MIRYKTRPVLVSLQLSLAPVLSIRLDACSSMDHAVHWSFHPWDPVCCVCYTHKKKQINLYTKQLKYQATLVVMICAWMTSSPPSDGGLQPRIPMRCQQCSLTTVSPLISFFAGLAGFVSLCVDNMQNCRDVSRTQLNWCVYAHCDACGAMWGNTYAALRQIQAARLLPPANTHDDNQWLSLKV